MTPQGRNLRARVLLRTSAALLLRLVPVLAMAMLLGSCFGQGSGDDSGPGIHSGQGNSGAEVDSGAQADNGAQAEITLKLMQFKAEITDQVLAMAEDYMTEHPGIRIEAQVLKDYDISLITSFASGDAPDIFSIKAFTEMDDWSARLADLSDEPWMKQVIPSALEGMTVDGKKLGFPMAIEGYGFIYNLELFEQAGIASVPTTVAELGEANRKLRAVGIRSYSEGYKEWWILGQHLFNLPFAYEPEPIAFIERIDRGEAAIGDLQHIGGFFDVLDMTLAYGSGADSASISYDEQVYNFATAQAAMMQQGVWTIESIRRINPDLRIGMFAIPLSDQREDTRLPVGVPGYYVLNKQSKHLEESKAFLSWLHQNGQKYLVDSFKFIPAFTDLETTDALGPLAVDLTKYARAGQTIPWVHAMWPSGSNSEFAKPLQAYVGGGLDRAATLASLQQLWEGHGSPDRYSSAVGP